MDNEKRDKLIIETLGGCWHEWNGYSGPGGPYIICYKCKKDHQNAHPNSLSTSSGFFWVWDRAILKEWFREFAHDFCKAPIGFNVFPNFYINPDRFAAALAEFLEGRKC